METLGITSVQELSLSLYFRSFHRQNNKNPAWHLMHNLHSKLRSPGCSTTGVPKHHSPAAFHLLPAPPDHSTCVNGFVLPPKDAFRLRSLPRAGPVGGGWHLDAKLCCSLTGLCWEMWVLCQVVGWHTGSRSCLCLLNLDLKI